MLIINADDWGRSQPETDAAAACFGAGRITSTTAMMFMADSGRSAELAREIKIDVGLHLNFTEGFTGGKRSEKLENCHAGTVRYLKRKKYAQLLYHPALRKQFDYSCRAQLEEFARLYGKPPSHIDGHHHMHLCANLLLSHAIPAGVKMRRNFSFWPGEKSRLNRAYRWLVDRWLARRFCLPDYFFDLSQSIQDGKLGRVIALAKHDVVELMTHPILESEFKYLMSDEFEAVLQPLPLGTYALVEGGRRTIRALARNPVGV